MRSQVGFPLGSIGPVGPKGAGVFVQAAGYLEDGRRGHCRFLPDPIVRLGAFDKPPITGLELSDFRSGHTCLIFPFQMAGVGQQNEHALKTGQFTRDSEREHAEAVLSGGRGGDNPKLERFWGTM
ncbi:MAG TPA: hypothetical protein VIY49_37300 [Bryobacteraceae bacterium]